jgi:hypothetical protein
MCVYLREHHPSMHSILYTSMCAYRVHVSRMNVSRYRFLHVSVSHVRRTIRITSTVCV